jgi:hypothetical protein
MSTRCQILVTGSDVVIYRHSDGYPDSEHGVLHDLLPLVREFKKYRGDDPLTRNLSTSGHIFTTFAR